MKRDVIIACDFAGREETLRFLDQFENEKPFVKIGMELFYGEGPQIVREIKARGHEVFLDLKLHDIPNTVKKAMRNLAVLGADMVNLRLGHDARGAGRPGGGREGRAAPADRGDAAHQHQRANDAGRAFDSTPHGRSGGALRAKRAK